MTEKEVDELFGPAKLKFSGYYKYTFTYKGSHKGYSIYVSGGGDVNDIYKTNYAPEEFFSTCDDWTSIIIKDNRDNIVFEVDKF